MPNRLGQVSFFILKGNYYANVGGNESSPPQLFFCYSKYVEIMVYNLEISGKLKSVVMPVVNLNLK